MVKIKNAIKMPSELVRRTVVVLNIKQIVSQHFYSKKKKNVCRSKLIMEKPESFQ